MNRFVELKFGCYHLLQEIGRGASSRVYLVSKLTTNYQDNICQLPTTAQYYHKQSIEENQNPNYCANRSESHYNLEGDGNREQKDVESQRKNSCELKEISFQKNLQGSTEYQKLPQFGALKEVIIQGQQPQQKKKQKQFNNELELLQHLNYPGIIKLIDYSISQQEESFPKELRLLTEWGSCGNFLRFIDAVNDKQVFRNRKNTILKYYVIQIVAIIDYLQTMHVSHRDIKAQNFVLDDYYRLKLIDFGLAERYEQCRPTGAQQKAQKVQQRGERGYIGSKHYISPEMTERSRKQSVHKQYYSKTDLWSLGVLLYFINVGKYPFQGQNTFYILQAIKKQQLNLQCIDDRNLRELVEMLLKKKPEERWGMGDVKRCKYFQGVNFGQAFENESPVLSIMNRLTQKYQYKDQMMVRINGQSKRRLVGLLRRNREGLRTQNYSGEQKNYSQLDIKKNCSENTEMNSQKKIQSQKDIVPEEQNYYDLTIAKINSKAIPKHLKINNLAAVESIKNGCKITWNNQLQSIKDYPQSIELKFQSEQQRQKFMTTLELAIANINANA